VDGAASYAPELGLVRLQYAMRLPPRATPSTSRCGPSCAGRGRGAAGRLFLMSLAHGPQYAFFSIYLVDHGYSKSGG